MALISSAWPAALTAGEVALLQVASAKVVIAKQGATAQNRNPEMTSVERQCSLGTALWG